MPPPAEKVKRLLRSSKQEDGTRNGSQALSSRRCWEVHAEDQDAILGSGGAAVEKVGVCGPP
jgi:hypothetical protein